MKRLAALLLFCAVAPADAAHSPVEFQGSASERIKKAFEAASADGSKRVVVPEFDPVSADGVWRIDRAIEVPAGFSLILESCTVEMRPGVGDDVVRAAPRAGEGGLSSRIEVLGTRFRKSVLRGGRVGVRLQDVDGFVVGNLEIGGCSGPAVALDGACRNGRVTNVRIGGGSGISVAGAGRGVRIERIYDFEDAGVALSVGCAATVTNVWGTARFADAEPPVPALVPSPRALRSTGGAFLAPSAYVTRDWISFSRDASLRPEAYRLSVRRDGVFVSAADERGELRAMATLRQLGCERTKYRNCDFYTGGDWGAPLLVPCCEVEAWPEYRWRGILIDEGRHFFGKETVKHVLDQMAYHKFNVLHWHLTEDQGWRIAVDAYPKLVEYGAVRPQSPVCFARGDEMNGEKYGPYFYTKDDIREVVAYAAERGIDVVPEIEFPGHVRAALAAYPEFSCRGPYLSRVPRCTWGIEEDVLCVGNEEAMKFVENVLDEVVALFPFKYVHIGGDECPTVRWKACPKCRAKAESLGIAPERLQGYVTSRFAAYLEKKGRRIVGWDEILDCDIPKSACVMSWRGRSGGFRAAKEGRGFVMCPSSHCYLNRADGNPDDPFTPRNTHQVVTLEKVYGFDPAEGLDADSRRHLLGSEACFWSEVIWNRYDLDWKMWPRSCALAEALWKAPAKRDVGEFRSRLCEHRRRLVARGVNAAPVF